MAAMAQAQVARVLETRGTALVERAGQPARFLGSGEPLNERDVISVARDSWAIIEFNDQTRVSLRPNTVFRLDAYKADAPETMLLGLTKGGLRVVTGLFGKRNPRGVNIQTATATIGIRGTEFDARLCDADCAAEERAKPAPRQVLLPVARVVEMNGVVGAGRAGEAVRLLVPGAMLNEGDAVATGRNSSAVLVFSDGARVSLVANSRFAINRYRYEESSRSGSAFLTLYAGNALVTTGQLARISPDAFLFRTALGVIRPFGTTFSGGGCVGNFCASGSVTVNSDGASASGSASGGGASASGTASAGSGGASASGTASTGSNTASGSTSTLVLPTSGTAGMPSGQDIVNEVVTGVSNVIAVVVNTTTTQGQNMQQQANNLATGAQNQLQETTHNASAVLVNQAVNALNTATAPIVAEMTALMTQMRNNPPQTAAAAQQLSTRIGQLSQLLNTAVTGARNAAGVVAQSDAFRAAYGLAMAEYLTFHSLMAGPMQGAGMAGAGDANIAAFNTEIARILADPYALGSVGLVGLSAVDLMEARNAGAIIGGAVVIQREVAAHVAAQGGAAAKSFFNEAQSTATTLQQRAAQEAARVAEETARKAAEAVRLAAEAKAAADAKLAAEQKAAAEKAAADKLLAEERLAQAKTLAEAQARAAADKAVAALDAATAPIVAQMTTLMAQLRDNPPQTEAARQAIASRIQALSSQLDAAINQAMKVAGNLAQSDQFLAAVALIRIEGVAQSAVGYSMSGGHVSGMGAAPGPGASRGGGTSASSGEALGRTFTIAQIAQILASPDMLRGMQLIGLTVEELRAISKEPNGLIMAGMIRNELRDHLESQGSAAAKAFFAELQLTATAAQQRAEQEAARLAAEAARLAAEAKAATEAKAAADKKLAEQKIAEAKRLAEAGVQGTVDGLRTYDIDGALIAVVGPPDVAIGNLITLPGPPVVTRVGDNVITTWVEKMVNVVHTAHGGVSIDGTVNRTEISGPGGVTTILTFNMMFVDPMVTVLVPHIGGPLISLGDGKPGTVQVTHRAPDGTTTVSYPGNQDDSKNPSSVAVLDGEVEVIDRGRVLKGEMLASTGDKLRLTNVAAVPDIKVDPDLFKDTAKPVEEGLYVWVRDGAVQLTQDNKSVDVAAGNAAIATKDTLRVLDTVPGFLRFDNTPRPFPALPGSIDIFRASDGAMLNMCSIR